MADAGEPDLNANADMDAAPAANKTLGGIDIELLTPLERAAGMGAAESIAALLAGSETVTLDIVAADERPLRRTVLHWAAFGGNPEVVSAVLQGVTEIATAAFIAQQTAATSDENATSAGTPVATAAAVAAALVTALEATCLRTTNGPGGMTPLHLAAEHGHTAGAVALLGAGAVDDHMNNAGHMPLFLAVEAGHEQMILELLRRGELNINSSITNYSSTALHIAAVKGHLAIVELLLREGASVDARDGGEDTPLHMAAVGGHQTDGAVINALLSAGTDIHAVGTVHNTALFKAVSGPYHETSDRHPGPVIRALMAGGADPHEWGEPYNISSVELAIWNHECEALSAMLDLGVDPNTRKAFLSPPRPLSPGASLLQRLCHKRRTRRRPKYGGDSLLHLAARLLSVGAVELLLSAGAHEGIPAFSAPPQDPTAVSTLPADVIGVEITELTPETEDTANAIKSMLARAELFRHGWLSVLRARFDAGESLAGSAGGGSGCVEIPVRGRHKTGGKAAGGVGSVVGQDNGTDAAPVVDGVWYGAAVWLATVPDEEVFRMVVEYL